MPALYRARARPSIRIPRGPTPGRHRHPYSTVVYVLEGTFRLEIGEREETVTDYRLGEAFSEPAGTVVNGRALTATKLLVVLPKEGGKPQSVAV
jgi:quercetin dioxygenase-like cupin family protein